MNTIVCFNLYFPTSNRKNHFSHTAGEFASHASPYYEETHLWISAANELYGAHVWHKNNSMHTKVLYKVACRVCSKVLGIGGAERSWKKMKRNMSGERAKVSTTKAKMQATIAGIHAQENNDEDRAKKMRAGVLWEDEDFRTIALDPNVLPLDEAPDDEIAKRKSRVFRGWIEQWEDGGLGPRGCPIIEQKILNKYGGLKWVDPDSGNTFTAHPDKASFQKKRGANSYELFGILDGYDDDTNDEDQSDYWEVWFRDCAIEEIAAYYRSHEDEGVLVYDKGEIPESGDEGDDKDDNNDLPEN